MDGRTKGLLAISTAVFIWGFNFIGSKVLLMEANPFAVMFVRQLASAILFFIVWKILGHSVMEDVREHWRSVLPLSLLGIVGNQVFYVWGISLTTPAHSALMYTLLPISTALFARWLIVERIVTMRWLGILIGFVGAALLATEEGINFAGDLLRGDLITFLGVIVFALFMVLGKPVLMRLGALRVLVVAYALALPVVLPLTAWPALQQDWIGLSLEAWGGLIFLIFFATVIAYLLHQYALKQLSASLLSAFAYTQPVLAAMFSVLLLKEQLSVQFFISFGLIAMGLFITERYKGRNAAVEVNR